MEKKQPYDMAAVGSSALLAALKRNLKAELVFWLGDHVATILNDFDKYFLIHLVLLFSCLRL